MPQYKVEIDIKWPPEKVSTYVAKIDAIDCLKAQSKAITKCKKDLDLHLMEDLELGIYVQRLQPVQKELIGGVV